MSEHESFPESPDVFTNRNGLGQHHFSRRAVLRLMAAAPVAAGATWAIPGVAYSSQSTSARSGRSTADPALEEKIRQLIDKPEFTGQWSLKFASVGTGESICALDSAVPHRLASAIKQFYATTAFEQLGPDRTFPTRIYATGPVRHGVLHGDMVLVAGGDLLLGSRVQPDGSMYLEAPDHGYAANFMEEAKPIPGDPLRSIRELADQVAAHGIRRVSGTVRVDTSLFRQAPSNTGGSPMTTSPLMINDNIIDITIVPGAKAGEPASVTMSPQTPYLQIVNQLRTIDPETETAQRVAFTDDITHPDGTHTATLTGGVPAGVESLLFPYFIPDPGRFGEYAFATALQDKGIQAEPPAVPEDRGTVATTSHHGRPLAELVTVPLAKQVWPMLKVSSNPHAANLPYVVGAIASGDPENARDAYESLQSDLFVEAGLDPHPPGSERDLYSPDFFVTFLDHIHGKPYLDSYLDALDDENPAGVPAFTKGGSGFALLPDGRTEFHLAGAGYLAPPGKDMVGFAVLTEQTTKSDDPAEKEPLDTLMRDTMGEILATVYDALA
ncbi:D-alanyl-D-alanine carboxypeptidase [Jiangella asiatica]|uniref:Serine-type D-Ala-D-Ala carboxypeptidase n=1 Tax=Jiangella asiatica TaxID=2530372 RepID=A0A4R5DNR7_9ACTN|nr:D-alanyl-D-alanine carboxypeptidase [Jiangella asiatica]TDE15982.1 hypothetical protein E1269_01450 [Jiangella asiatica]